MEVFGYSRFWRNPENGAQNMWLELTRRTYLRSHSKDGLVPWVRFALHTAGAQLNHVVLRTRGEIQWSARDHPLPASRACRFAADPSHLVTSGSGLNIVAVNRDRMLLV